MIWRALILCTLLAAAASTARGAATDAPALSADNLRAFADDFVARTMEKHHVPGAACVIVKDGRLVYSRGYGFADVERKLPFDPARTGVAVGSISKLVTATAVLQLVERGELSLDGDVRPLLASAGVHIDNPFDPPGRPMTLRQLLDHTGGFDQGYLGCGVRDPARLPALDELLRHEPPRCVIRPGELISYSDVGYLLAARLVELKSGMRFERYVEEHVLRPLGMNASGFASGPGAAELIAARSAGYEWMGDYLRNMPTLYVKAVPCAGLMATPEDFAPFMIAHLGDGSWAPDGSPPGRVLRGDTVRTMHERQAGYDAAWDGVTLGFYDRRLTADGRRVLTHGGVGPGMTSNLFLLPDEKIGCFFTFNVWDYRILEVPPEAFVRHFFPEPPAATRSAPPSIPAGQVRRFVGKYRHVAYPRRTLEKLQQLTDHISIGVGSDGATLVANVNASDPGPQTFAPSGAQRFLQVTGEGRLEIGFREDAAGNVTHLLVAAEAYERLPWIENPSLHRRLFKLAALGFAWGGLGWPIGRFAWGWWTRRRAGRAPARPLRRRAVRTDRLLAVTCAIQLIFLAAFAYAMADTTSDEFVCGPPIGIRLLLWLPLLAGALTLLCAVLALCLLADARSARLGRLHRVAIVAGAVAFLPLLYYWNMLGFNY